MITQTGLNKVADRIKGLIANGRYTKDGVVGTIALHSTKLEGNILSVYLLFDNAFAGNFTKFELIDIDGAVFADQPDNITKVDTKLLLVTFKFTVTEVIN